jgi:prevent-host-death family protein
MSDVVPFTEAKAHLSELVDRVAREHDRVTVTKNGRPVAVLISPEDLEGLEETVEILQDEELMKGLRRSLQQVTEGRTSRLQDHFPRGL